MEKAKNGPGLLDLVRELNKSGGAASKKIPQQTATEVSASNDKFHGDRLRFNRLLGAAVKPKKSSDQK